MDALLRMFAKTTLEAIKCYKHFVAEGKGVDLWQNLKSQVYLGDETFVKEHKVTIKDYVDIVLNEVPKKQIRAKAYLSGGYSMKEIVSYFDVHYSKVSRAVAQCKT
ncbi:hypothetical protein [Pseudoalteromonas sp. C2R02]|uniref:hypothetical protein n=1 Tax=Pseudoalteromonas sp. C2R02 TaxID=2841565 RepID=UPI002090737C|nr:hypothetical protein [Pseudoalteromonas sp. C2R02]